MQPEDMVVLCLALLLPILVSFVLFTGLFRIWLRAFLSGQPVLLLQILGARLRGNPPALLVDTLLALKHRGESSTLDEVEKVYISHKGHEFTPGELADVVVESRA